MSEIDALLKEDRRFPPDATWRTSATVTDPGIYERAARDPEAFWAEFARELEWMRPWDTVLKWTPPYARWFEGGKINASANCLDRHVRTARRNKAAIVWEGEPGDRRTLTYWDLYRQVGVFANVLKSLGVKRADRVALYLPHPRLAIAMLACACGSGLCSVVFGGFGASAPSRCARINDAQACLSSPPTADFAEQRRPAQADGRRGAGDAVDPERRGRAPAGRPVAGPRAQPSVATTGYHRLMEVGRRAL